MYSTLQRLRRILVEPPASIHDVALQHKSRLLNYFLLVMIVVFICVDGIYLATIPGYMPPWYGYVFLFGSYALNRKGYYQFSAPLTLSMFPIVIVANIVSGESSAPLITLYYLIPGLVLASILLPFKLTVLFAVVESAIIISMPFVARKYFVDTDSIVGPLSTHFISVVLVLVSIYHRDRVETERQEALRKSEESNRAIIENALFGIFQSTPEGRYIRVNSAIARIYGYDSPQDMIDSIQDIASQVYVDAADRQRMVRSMESEGFVAGFIVRNRRKDNSIIWVSSSSRAVKDSQGKIEYFEGTVEDITEKQNMEQARRLSEERYRLITSVMSDYVFSNVQNEKGEIVLNWVAGAFEQISGYTLEEFNARGGWVATVHPDDLEQDAQDMEILRRGETVISELRIILKDGSIRWVRNYAHPILDSQQKKLIGIYGAVQNISKRKGIEHEREHLIQELEAKNAELEQFTYTVSHDLKAPIITIKGFLGFLAEDARSGNIERLDGDIQRISEAAEKMHYLLNDLLELSRVGRVMNQSDEIDLAKLVAAVQETLHARLSEGGIKLTVEPSLPKVYGDSQRLLEVFQNLLDNAAKFMGEQAQPNIHIGAAQPAKNGFATIYVRDNGIGIAPQFHERIFGLFNRLNPEIDGTGVGLSLVKRIVEFHGGRVWVESEAGAGATFYFTLPLPPAKEAGSNPN